jgi:hypothetical protein
VELYRGVRLSGRGRVLRLCVQGIRTGHLNERADSREEVHYAPKLIYEIKDHQHCESFSLVTVAGLGGLSAGRWIHRSQGRASGKRGDLLASSP